MYRTDEEDANHRGRWRLEPRLCDWWKNVNHILCYTMTVIFDLLLKDTLDMMVSYIIH